MISVNQAGITALTFGKIQETGIGLFDESELQGLEDSAAHLMDSNRRRGQEAGSAEEAEGGRAEEDCKQETPLRRVNDFFK